MPSNQSNLDIWQSNWIPKSPNLRLAIEGPISNSVNNLTIRDIWDNNKWDLKKITFVLPQPLRNSILSIYPKFCNKDTTTWALTADEKFTSKSCYKLVSLCDPNTTDFS